jgi:hypothetical protein
VFAIFHLGQIVAIHHHGNLMGRLAGVKGNIGKQYGISPKSCTIKVKLGGAPSVAEKLSRRLNPPWNPPQEKPRPITTHQLVTGDVLDTPLLTIIEDLVIEGCSNVVISEKLNARGLKSWTGKTWTPSNVARFLRRESKPIISENERTIWEGPNMAGRFNPKISYSVPESEAAESLRLVLERT